MSKDRLTYTVVSKKNSIGKAIEFTRSLKEDFSLVCNSNLGIVGESEYRRFSPIDISELILNKQLDTNDGNIDLSLRNIFLSSLSSFENDYPGSSIVNYITFMHAMDKTIQNMAYRGNKTKDTEIKHAMHLVSKSSRCTTKEIAKDILEVYLKEKKISSLVMSACALSGHNGQIYVDKIGQQTSVVETYRGNRIALTPIPEFWQIVKGGKWARSHVTCFVIDGIIESVSEIHHLLEYASKEKCPMAIFARGYSEEVIATLALNFKRGSVDVIPIKVQYDMLGANLLKDIAVICGCDITSSLKGELISSIELDNIKPVYTVTCNNEGVIIHNPRTIAGVQHHVSNLIKDKEESNSKEKADVIEERIKALSSTCTKISLEQTSDDLYPLLVNKIGKGIKIFSTIARSGIINLEDIKLHKLNISNDVLNTLENVVCDLRKLGFKNIPAVSFLYGFQGGYHAAQAIDTVGAYMVTDNKQ